MGEPVSNPARHYVSVVVPLYNEEKNVASLLDELLPVLDNFGHQCELLLVNDGSRDQTGPLATELSKRDKRIRVIHLRHNVGQTAAMMAGFDNARGDVIVPIDGDLQNDPADIPRLVEMLDQGFDVVSGWRNHRSDQLILRRYSELDSERNHFACFGRKASRLWLHAEGVSARRAFWCSAIWRAASFRADLCELAGRPHHRDDGQTSRAREWGLKIWN